MALLFGSGLQNGSPFYTGYQDTPVNIEAPTGLMSLLTVMEKLKGTVGAGEGMASEYASSYTTKKGTDEEMHAQGQVGQFLTSQLNDIDATIFKKISIMTQKAYDTKSYPTTDKWMEGITQDRNDLLALYQERDRVKGTIPEAGNALQQVYEFGDEAEKNNARGNMALHQIGGVFTPYGVNDNGDIKTNQDVYTEAKLGGNIIPNKRTGKYDVVNPDLPFGTNTVGKFQEFVDKKFAAAKGYTDITSNEIVDNNGNIKKDVTTDMAIAFLQTHESKNNYQAVNAAVESIKHGMTMEEKRDVVEQFYNDFSKGEGYELTDDEQKAVGKSISGANMSPKELQLLESAQDKYIAGNLRNEAKMHYDVVDDVGTKTKVKDTGDGTGIKGGLNLQTAMIDNLLNSKPGLFQEDAFKKTISIFDNSTKYFGEHADFYNNIVEEAEKSIMKDVDINKYKEDTNYRNDIDNKRISARNNAIKTVLAGIQGLLPKNLLDINPEMIRTNKDVSSGILNQITSGYYLKNVSAPMQSKLEDYTKEVIKQSTEANATMEVMKDISKTIPGVMTLDPKIQEIAANPKSWEYDAKTNSYYFKSSNPEVEPLLSKDLTKNRGLSYLEIHPITPEQYQNMYNIKNTYQAIISSDVPVAENVKISKITNPQLSELFANQSIENMNMWLPGLGERTNIPIGVFKDKPVTLDLTYYGSGISGLNDSGEGQDLFMNSNVLIKLTDLANLQKYLKDNNVKHTGDFDAIEKKNLQMASNYHFTPEQYEKYFGKGSSRDIKDYSILPVFTEAFSRYQQSDYTTEKEKYDIGELLSNKEDKSKLIVTKQIK